MTVGATDALTPAATTCSAASASASSITSVPTQRSDNGPRPGRRPARRARRAGGRRDLSTPPRPRSVTPRRPVPRRAEAPTTPGTASIGPIDTTGFEGATTTTSARLERGQHPRRAAWRALAPRSAPAVDHDRMAQFDEVLLEGDLLGRRRAEAGCAPGRRSSANRRMPSPKARRDLGGHLARARPFADTAVR